MEVITVVAGKVPNDLAKIVGAAVRARLNAYAPYSKFPVLLLPFAFGPENLV